MIDCLKLWLLSGGGNEMNKVFMILIILSMSWLGGCATMFSEGKWRSGYPLEIKAKDGQKAFFHVAGLGYNASTQITGQAPQKLYLPLSASSRATTPNYRVGCENADGEETKVYLIQDGYNNLIWLNYAIPLVGLVFALVDFSTGAAYELYPDEVEC